MQPYKYIVFDFDGTLVDSRSIFISLYNELAVKHGYALMTEDNLPHLRSMSISERCKCLNVPLYRIPFLVSAVIKKYKDAIPQLEFNKDIEQLLGSLAMNNIKYAVLSSNSKKNIAQFFELKGIANKNVYCSRSVFGKHVLLNKFLKEKKLDPSEILYVGDELRDVIACRKSNVKVAWVSWGYDNEQVLKNNKPDHVLHDPADLLKLALQKPV
ncbi:HAD hydrolase-like protein [Flavobacterium cerinum]|uniref:HAD family hydrolase n=1 Tax=Flavobacterium cerinum TaxID=2502784 RepID=A0A444GN76_9FLAO|nr:HAD hydrolase-like protein [Flavobacterium cerinum]RWW92361.1 HAD family hydrolase [Flavobacterium cerinum]